MKKRIALLLGVMLLSGCGSSNLSDVESNDTDREKVTTSTSSISEETTLETTVSEPSEE